MDHHRLEHQGLAALIKGVHKHLRRKFRESNGDYQAVWDFHAQDHDKLKSYANAMKQLATDHWSEYPESRIDWCYHIIVDYFLHGGQLRALEKDAKHRFFESKRKREVHEKTGFTKCEVYQDFNKSASESNKIHPYPVASSTVAFTVSKEVSQHLKEESFAISSLKNSEDRLSDGLQCATLGDQSCIDQPSHSHHACQTKELDDQQKSEQDIGDPLHHPDLYLPVTGHHYPLRLLDVGSCYNPFRTYEHLDPVAVDLWPADSSVLQCDFLHLDLIPPNSNSSTNSQEKSQKEDLNTPDFINQLQSPVQKLPACSFDVVVFCLLLEYLPSPAQRAQCCIKAVQLLRLNGLLLIITPDSKSPHRNAPMMNAWRSALTQLGMARWKYQKMQHLHCMAYRKASETDFDNVSVIEKQLSPLLHIPQDFTDACYDVVERVMTDQEQQDFLKTCQENEAFRFSVFEELPIFLDDCD